MYMACVAMQGENMPIGYDDERSVPTVLDSGTREKASSISGPVKPLRIRKDL